MVMLVVTPLATATNNNNFEYVKISSLLMESSHEIYLCQLICNVTKGRQQKIGIGNGERRY